MYFHQMQSRLLALLRDRLQSGGLSERRLAGLTGMSQPHIHNVLKGRRRLSPQVADQILLRLGISVVDLLQGEDLSPSFCSNCTQFKAFQEVPVLEGRLGPGLPMPRTLSRFERYAFPKSYLAPLHRPVVARLATDPRMAPILRESDHVLLDHLPHKRSRTEWGALYLINSRGEGIIRRLRQDGSRLWLIAEDSLDTPERWEDLPTGGMQILDIVRAEVVWLGRHLGDG
jgi:transcriptional regulator with XRE-family HTH domain